MTEPNVWQALIDAAKRAAPFIHNPEAEALRKAVVDVEAAEGAESTLTVGKAWNAGQSPQVVIDMGKPIRWFGLPLWQARQFAKRILTVAKEIESGQN